MPRAHGLVYNSSITSVKSGLLFHAYSLQSRQHWHKQLGAATGALELWLGTSRKGEGRDDVRSPMPSPSPITIRGPLGCGVMFGARQLRSLC